LAPKVQKSGSCGFPFFEFELGWLWLVSSLVGFSSLVASSWSNPASFSPTEQAADVFLSLYRMRSYECGPLLIACLLGSNSAAEWKRGP
jgi:hypothetical protein